MVNRESIQSDHNKKRHSCLQIALLLGMSFFFFIFSARAQSSNKLIRQGNMLYKQQQFPDAEADYKKALAKDQGSSTGFFNLGNTLYRQKRYDEAMQQYAASAKAAGTSPLAQSDAQYNIGNTFMENKKWQQSIDAYKQALLKNPDDAQARYNLAYAQEMLKKQQNKDQQNKNQQNKDNKDQQNQQNKDQSQQNQNNQNKDQNQQNQDNKDQQNKDQQNKDQDQQQQHPQPQPSRLTQQQADQLLNALAQQEKKLQDKKNDQKKGVPVAGGKDW